MFTIFSDIDDNRLVWFVCHEGEREEVGSASWSGKDTGNDVYGTAHVEPLHVECNDRVLLRKTSVLLDVKVDWGPF